MNIARSAALIAQLFGRVPGARSTVHAAALGGVLALAGLAPSANAAVVASPISNLAIPVNVDGVYINVVTGATGTSGSALPGYDINPWGSSSLFIYSGTGGGIVLAGGAIANLALGTVVGPAATFGAAGGAASTSSAAPWTLNSTDYFGFSFIGEDTLLHYGYASVILGAAFNSPSRMIGGIWYDSAANTAITVGATTSAVPEASSGAMLLAGAGALAAMALRRRRQTDV